MADFEAIIEPLLEPIEVAIFFHTPLELRVYIQYFPEYHSACNYLFQLPPLFQPICQYFLSTCTELSRPLPFSPQLYLPQDSNHGPYPDVVWVVFVWLEFGTETDYA